MWVVLENGNAINNVTGEEMYMDRFNGITYVYRDHKKIGFFASNSEAIDFIKKRVEELNGEN